MTETRYAVIGAGWISQIAFLPAAMEQRSWLHTISQPKRTNALGTINFMTGKRHQIAPELIKIHRNLAQRLHRIGMKNHIALRQKTS